MTTEQSVGSAKRRVRPPALRLRELRERYGEGGLSADDLANLAGISAPDLRRLEAAARLPRALDSLARVAFALQVPLQALLDDEQMRALWAGIARRRQDREGGPGAPIGFRPRS